MTTRGQFGRWPISSHAVTSDVRLRLSPQWYPVLSMINCPGRRVAGRGFFGEG